MLPHRTAAPHSSIATRPAPCPSRLFAKASALAIAAAALLSLNADAHTLRLANQGDPMSMDPHSLQESFQLSFLGNIYEPPIF